MKIAKQNTSKQVFSEDQARKDTPRYWRIVGESRQAWSSRLRLKTAKFRQEEAKLDHAVGKKFLKWRPNQQEASQWIQHKTKALPLRWQRGIGQNVFPLPHYCTHSRSRDCVCMQQRLYATENFPLDQNEIRHRSTAFHRVLPIRMKNHPLPRKC